MERAIVMELVEGRSFREILANRRSLVRAWGILEYESPTMPAEDRLYAFDDLHPAGQEEHIPVQFEHEGGSWTVFDQWCLRPWCACDEVCLRFFEISVRPVKTTLEHAFALRSDLDGRSPTTEVGKELTSKQEQLFDAYLGMLKSSGMDLRLRRTLIRKIGRKRLDFDEPRAVGAVARNRIKGIQLARRGPTRNQPCPYGSGKKFKRCCGMAS